MLIKLPPFQPLLFGFAGVALGRLTVGFDATKGTPADGNQKTRKVEKVEQVLRALARLIQSHMTDSDAFSERLDSASDRLARNSHTGLVKESVLALIRHNRDIREKMERLRNQLVHA